MLIPCLSGGGGSGSSGGGTGRTIADTGGAQVDEPCGATALSVDFLSFFTRPMISRNLNKKERNKIRKRNTKLKKFEVSHY